jgi:hypothetical protein
LNDFPCLVRQRNKKAEKIQFSGIYALCILNSLISLSFGVEMGILSTVSFDLKKGQALMWGYKGAHHVQVTLCTRTKTFPTLIALKDYGGCSSFALIHRYFGGDYSTFTFTTEYKILIPNIIILGWVKKGRRYNG